MTVSERDRPPPERFPHHFKFALSGFAIGSILSTLGVGISGYSEGSSFGLAVLFGGGFGFWFALAIWVTLQKRRLPLIVRVPAWALVCAVASIFVFWLPAAIWCYAADVRLTHVDHSPNSVFKALGTGGLVSVLLTPVGFLFGAIFAFFKRPRESNARHQQ